MLNFFLQPDPLFGGVSYATGLFWLAGLAVGVYLLTQWRDANPVRYGFGRRFGMIATALSAIGLIFLLLNFFQVAPLNIRFPMYLIGLASLLYLGYAIYAYNTTLPAQIAAIKPSRVVRGTAPRGNASRGGAKTYAATPSRGGAKTYPAAGTPTGDRPPREPRPAATTTRREARRGKKRKSR